MIESTALTLGRCLLGLYFLLPGIMKITGYAGSAAYMHQHGIPLVTVWLPLTIVLQVGGGVALMLGFRLRDIALMLGLLTLAINFGMHDFWNIYPETSQPHEVQNFVKNLGIFAGLMVLASTTTLPQWRPFKGLS